VRAYVLSLAVVCEFSPACIVDWQVAWAAQLFRCRQPVRRSIIKDEMLAAMSDDILNEAKTTFTRRADIVRLAVEHPYTIKPRASYLLSTSFVNHQLTVEEAVDQKEARHAHYRPMRESSRCCMSAYKRSPCCVCFSFFVVVSLAAVGDPSGDVFRAYVGAAEQAHCRRTFASAIS
jgi:hypothetical protein